MSFCILDNKSLCKTFSMDDCIYRSQLCLTLKVLMIVSESDKC